MPTFSQGWINHVRYADSWGLREHMLNRFVWGPDSYSKNLECRKKTRHSVGAESVFSGSVKQ